MVTWIRPCHLYTPPVAATDEIGDDLAGDAKREKVKELVFRKALNAWKSLILEEAEVVTRYP